MKKTLFSLLMSVVALAPAHADEYTGILVTDGNQKVYYLFEEQPVVKYQYVNGVTRACVYLNPAVSTDPVFTVRLSSGSTMTVSFDKFERINLNAAGYATFSCKEASFIATEGVTAYKAVVDGEVINLTALGGNIPAGTGVVLYGETPNTNVNLPVATSGSLADVTNNALKPTTFADGTLAQLEGNSWVLGTGNQFLQFTGRTYIPNRAYLVHEQNSSAAPLSIVFGDDVTTSIDTNVSEKAVRDGKFLENGRIVILKDGVKYNVAGQVIK